MILLPWCLAAQVRAVENNAHAWLIYSSDHAVNQSKWGLHFDTQIRRHGLASWQQMVVRPGVNYELNRVWTVSAGYGYSRSYAYSVPTATAPGREHRLWEQAVARYKTGRVNLASRLRFEQRFLGSTDPAKPGFRYENRFRTWQQVSIPITTRTYFTAYEEVVFYAKPYLSRSIVDQNRVSAGVGFRVHPAWRLEVAYLNQAVFQRSGLVRESNHTVLLAIYGNARLKFR